jgi:hypothetical protein
MDRHILKFRHTLLLRNGRINKFDNPLRQQIGAMEVLTIENLKETVTEISSTQCDFLSENCIVALENGGHQPGCPLLVYGDAEKEYGLQWSKPVNKSGYKESVKIVEHAAEALSFFLSSKLTEFTVVEEALIGTGIDYWLGYEDGHSLFQPDNFIRARLEISGIEKETAGNSLEKRVKVKKSQTTPTDSFKLPAYISVIEFSAPKAFFGKK